MGILSRGGCRCDALRFEITDVFDAGYCHCNRCRKQTGAPVFAFVHVPRGAFKLLCGEIVAEPSGEEQSHPGIAQGGALAVIQVEIQQR